MKPLTQITDENYDQYANIAHYAMFTVEGNEKIHALVQKAGNYSWNKVRRELEKISKIEGFGEATDTMVREAVYFTLYPEEVGV